MRDRFRKRQTGQHRNRPGWQIHHRRFYRRRLWHSKESRPAWRSLSALDPQNIESGTLLKDAASAADNLIYDSAEYMTLRDTAVTHSSYPNKFTQAQIDLYSNPNRDKHLYPD